MNIANLLNNFDDLTDYMKANNYSNAYIRKLKTEVNWLRKNHDLVDSYEEAYYLRVSKLPECSSMFRHYRLFYSILRNFDLYDIYPSRGKDHPLFENNSYSRLNNNELRTVVDLYEEKASARGLKGTTIRGVVSNASSFLLFQQEKGINNLCDITEESTEAFFTDNNGQLNKSYSYKKQISLLFKEDLGPFDEDAKRILSYLPSIKSKRKNIQYLKKDEMEAVHNTLNKNDDESPLSLRDIAICSLLVFTGIRACDIATLKIEDIDWNNDIINIVQNKTSMPQNIPLTAPVGNAIYDYLTKERQRCDDVHIFLTDMPSSDRPLCAGSINNIATKLYDVSYIRLKDGDRRGTHLFRHNAATTMASSNVPRPVISSVLGHGDPDSVDAYISADIDHLRECALSVEKFPVKEEVFEL